MTGDLASEDRSEVEATAYGVRRWFLSSVKRHVRHQCRRRDAKVIASEFDMTVHAQAARESSQNPDEQGT